MKVFLENPNYDIAYGDSIIIYESGRAMGFALSKDFDIYAAIRTWNNPINQPGTILKRSVLEKLGPLDIRLDFAMDFDYWLRAGLTGMKFKHLSSYVSMVRLHKSSKTNTRSPVRANDLKRIYTKIFEAENLREDLALWRRESLRSLYEVMAYCYYLAGISSQTHYFSKLAISMRPSRPSRGSLALYFSSLFGDKTMIAARTLWKFLRKRGSIRL